MIKEWNKLVRDKIPQNLAKKGINTQMSILQDEEYQKALNEKLLEEANEVVNSVTKEELTEEIADLMEVMESIIKNRNISLEEIKKVKEEKKATRGGFDDKVFLICTEEKEVEK